MILHSLTVQFTLYFTFAMALYFISGSGGGGASPLSPSARSAASEHAEHLLEPEEQLPVLLGDVLLEELLECVDALARDAAVEGVGQGQGQGWGQGWGQGQGWSSSWGWG